jgi:hypothetical protein
MPLIRRKERNGPAIFTAFSDLEETALCSEFSEAAEYGIEAPSAGGFIVAKSPATQNSKKEREGFTGGPFYRKGGGMLTG